MERKNLYEEMAERLEQHWKEEVEEKLKYLRMYLDEKLENEKLRDEIKDLKEQIRLLKYELKLYKGGNNE